ncbi:MAG: thymidine phosphorylase [Fimbriimonadaceae bacterium]|nr:thymidine phosphorylase [Fimbriimonadaceae bacterium]
MDAVSVIAHRRDGLVQTAEELSALANAAADGTWTDDQLAAWLMAAYLRPLTLDETADLTLAMAGSGERLDLGGLPRPRLDKHSTGGVGDKTTLVLLPLLASLGLTMVKMSGRGLGITGGTIDKLESVPGFRVDLTPQEMVAQAGQIGLALTGQTPRLAPADGKLYALRDVTATVASIPLITSSILSKKIAGGAETVVIDVKCGSGAFMRDATSARELASWLTEVGRRAGLHVATHVTDMDQPLGRCAGNALEVKEALAVLAGRETGRFADLCVRLAHSALAEVGRPTDIDEVRRALVDGRALAKARDWFAAQGADMTVFDSDDWACAPHVHDVVWPGPAGWVERIDAQAVGLAVVHLGGGRESKADRIDPTVGVETLVTVGDRVEVGQVVLRVHSRRTAPPDIAGAVHVAPGPVPASPLFLD